MPKTSGAAHNDGVHDSNHDKTANLPPSRKRKEVTTHSILEAFLLHKTSLDDTVTEEMLAKALASISSKKGSSGRAVKSSATLALLVQELNRQQRTKRAQIAGNIVSFSERYDALPADASVEDNDADAPEDLLKEDIDLREAIRRLELSKGQLQRECRDLETRIKEHEKALTGVVDKITAVVGA